MPWQAKYKGRLNKIIKILILPLFIITLMGFSALTENWRTIAPGIEYRDLNKSTLSPWAHIHVFRIDLAQNSLDSLLAKKMNQKSASIREFSKYSKALIAINGGFFDHNHNPLGLRIGQHTLHNPLKHISWWGVFYIKNNKAYLTNVSNFNVNKKIDFALQSGPRLLVKGKIPSLKGGVAERSALGIDKEGKVIIIVTERAPLSTTALAELMRSTLQCRDALNLDGGGSSQLAANLSSFQVNVSGFAAVSDAILVKGRG